MSANSSIEWTDTTWNPVRGCSVISPGCVNCYAMKQAHRFSGERLDPNTGIVTPGAYQGLTKQTKAGPQWTGKILTVEAALLEPLSWKKPQRVFVNSMSDLFHEGIPFSYIAEVFTTMAQTTRHTYQVLTKRPKRLLEFYQWNYRGVPEQEARADWLGSWPNVWLGVSVENQHFADERIPLLLQTPATVHFISAEPLLGPLNLTSVSDLAFDALHGFVDRSVKIDWVIVGGESGPGARPFDLGWARSIVAQCQSNAVPVFVKQLGAVPILGRHVDGAFVPDHEYLFHDRKGGDMNEWPADLRIREFPSSERPV